MHLHGLAARGPQDDPLRQRGHEQHAARRRAHEGHLSRAARPAACPSIRARCSSRRSSSIRRSLLADLRRVFESAARSNTAIYTLDPRGLAPSDFGIEDTVSQSVDRQMLNETTDLLRVIAGETDGRAIVSRNDPVPELQRMIRDNSAYYLLGYVSTAAPRDGKFHEIQVRVKRHGRRRPRAQGLLGVLRGDDQRRERGERAVRCRPPTSAPRSNASPPSPTRAAVARDSWLGARTGANSKAQVTFAWEAAAARRRPTRWRRSIACPITATSVAGEHAVHRARGEGSGRAEAGGPRRASTRRRVPVTVRIVVRERQGPARRCRRGLARSAGLHRRPARRSRRRSSIAAGRCATSRRFARRRRRCRWRCARSRASNGC